MAQEIGLTLDSELEKSKREGISSLFGLIGAEYIFQCHLRVSIAAPNGIAHEVSTKGSVGEAFGTKNASGCYCREISEANSPAFR